MEQISAYISRLLVGSFIVFSVRTLAGKGAFAEPMRLACACFMTILVLQPMWNGEVSLEAIQNVVAEAQAKVDLSIRAAEDSMDDQLCAGVEKSLMQLLAQQGIACAVQLRFGEDRRVEEIKLQCERELAAAGAKLLAGYCGLPEEMVIYMGEENTDAR